MAGSEFYCDGEGLLFMVDYSTKVLIVYHFLS